ncbi:MAG: LapA family protein [Alphaproteobacteria bacterium]|nr:LapA family protein [Alphaproteobacteria bacterium]MBF0130117.1 LapA family protein [Alphaproteobacteria bacterium]
MKILAWLTGAPLAIIAVAFSVANRDAVRLDLWPLPFSVDIPVYVTVLGSVAFGTVLGWMASWLPAARLRARLRARNARIEELERESGLAGGRPEPDPRLPAPES